MNLHHGLHTGKEHAESKHRGTSETAQKARRRAGTAPTYWSSS